MIILAKSPLNLNLNPNFPYTNPQRPLLDEGLINTTANVTGAALSATILAINAEVRDIAKENLAINIRSLQINEQLLKSQQETHEVNLRLLKLVEVLLKKNGGEINE